MWPGLIVAFAEGLGKRSRNAGRRPGRLGDLEALAGKRRGEPAEIVLEGDGWDGRRKI